MKTPSRQAPKALPPAVNNLIAEGGNVLPADDATLVEGTARVQGPPNRSRPEEHPGAAPIATPADAAARTGEAAQWRDAVIKDGK